MFHNAAPIAANVLQPCLPISYELIVNFPILFLQKTGITPDSFEKFYQQISAQNADDHLVTSWQSYRTRARGMTDKNRLFAIFLLIQQDKLKAAVKKCKRRPPVCEPLYQLMQVEAHSIHFLNYYFKPLVVKFLQSQADQRALESARLITAHRHLFKHVMDSSDDEDSESDLSRFSSTKRMRL